MLFHNVCLCVFFLSAQIAMEAAAIIIFFLHLFFLPYKKHRHNIIEALVLFDLCTFGALTLRLGSHRVPVSVFYILLALPLIYMIVYGCYKVAWKMGHRSLQ